MKTPKQPATGLLMPKLVSDPYVFRRASQQARALVLTAGFRWDDWEDLRQELLLDLLRRAPHFNAARSDWWAFVRGVMRNCSSVLAARKRRFAEREVFWEDLPADERKRAETRLGTDERLENGIEVRRVAGRLPQRIKQVVELLPDYSIPEICEKTGSSRSQVYRTRQEARSYFSRWGLAQDCRSVRR